jgi:hypothetical protein
MGVENFVTHNGECDFIVTGGDGRLYLFHSHIVSDIITPSQVTLNSTRLEASTTTVKPSKIGSFGLSTFPCPLRSTRPPLPV